MLLKELCTAHGISGDEYETRETIKKQLGEIPCEISTDSIGNLYAIKQGKADNKKVLVIAHMDEVGLMITSVTENGMLKFNLVGSIDERILASKKVLIGKNRIPGIIGVKPIHLQEKDEKRTALKSKNLYIDIGCRKKEEAEKLVELGDYIYFDSSFTDIGEGKVKSKAFDDRVGCAVLIDVLKNEYDFALQACFSVQEQIGLRGAKIAAFRLKPDVAIILEGTTCSDVPGVKETQTVTRMNEGPAISVIDKTTIANRKLLDFVVRTADANEIRHQIKEGIFGGNESGAIQTSCGGVPTVVISIPCRYIHSPVSVISLDDFEETKKLVQAVLFELQTFNI